MTYDIIKKSYEISALIGETNTLYIIMLARHIQNIGNGKEVNWLHEAIKADENIKIIETSAQKALGKALLKTLAICDVLSDETYQSLRKFYEYRNITQLPIRENGAIQQYLKEQKQLLDNTFKNLSQTTVIGEKYRKTINKAVISVRSGNNSFNSAKRNLLKEAAGGVKVRYKSGIERRLDSALRMNILGGVRSINNGVREIAGLEYNADGVEVSAHAMCASDHLEINGMQYSKADYEEVNANLIREVGTCNCHHFITPIILGVHERACSEQQIEEYKHYSQEKIYYRGSNMTRYEASQRMRKIETKMRYAKDKIIACRNGGDTEMLENAKKQLNELRKSYRAISKAAGLKTQYNRAYVPGFRE